MIKSKSYRCDVCKCAWGGTDLQYVKREYKKHKEQFPDHKTIRMIRMVEPNG